MITNMKRGKFIVFEGIDGCGKGTQAKIAISYIFDMDKRNDAYLTREPTRDRYEIRKRLEQGDDVKKDAEWYANMFIEDRKLHLAKYINPMLKNGTHVICDRYKYSTLAYQHAQGMELGNLIKRHENMTIPDLVFIFDCPAEVAFERRKNDGATDVFDKDLGFQEKLRNNYLELKQKLSNENIVIIDATKSIKEIKNEIIKNINILLGKSD